MATKLLLWAHFAGARRRVQPILIHLALCTTIPTDRTCRNPSRVTLTSRWKIPTCRHVAGANGAESHCNFECLDKMQLRSRAGRPRMQTRHSTDSRWSNEDQTGYLAFSTFLTHEMVVNRNSDMSQYKKTNHVALGSRFTGHMLNLRLPHPSWCACDHRASDDNCCTGSRAGGRCLSEIGGNGMSGCET